MESLGRLKSLALLLLRAALGVIFIYHGYPKLFVNPHGTMVGFEHMGFPSYFAIIAGVLETFGGALLILGLFTQITALLLAGEMLIALWRVHGMFTHPMAVNNYELPMALSASAFAIACIGAGTISLDRAVFGSRGGRAVRKSKD